MTEGIKKGGPDARIIYADIIDHPHWQSPTRPRMSLYDRCAQFASFNALTGYSDMIDEEKRLTDSKVELGETELELLNQKLTLIMDVIEDGHRPTVTITYFVPDEQKSGGRYETVTERVKKIDTEMQQIILMRTEGRAGMNIVIDIDQVVDITGELVDYLDGCL